MYPHKNTAYSMSRARTDTTLQKNRITLITSMLCLSFCCLTLRLGLIHLSSPLAIKTLPTQENLNPNIFDRNGVLLAGNLPTFSIYANAKHVAHKQETVLALKGIFPELDETVILQRLHSNKGFVWIKRHITPCERQKFFHLGLPGVSIQKDTKRFYPQNNLFAHVLGFTDIDGNGLCGLERHFNKRTDSVHTALDTRLQHIVHEELQSAIQRFGAKAGNAILLDTRDGSILSMVSLPDFNPNMPKVSDARAFFDRNVHGVYEFGSVMKVHNAAMALEGGVAKLKSRYDISRPLRMGRFFIKDFRSKHKNVTLHEAFLYSSNIANAKIALDAGIDIQKGFFEKLGFFQRVHLDTIVSASPLLPKTWRESTLATASYGYGIAITPLHLVQSVGAITTGFACPLTLTQKKCTKKIRLLKPSTVRNINLLLQGAATHGQAKNAHVAHYSIGAKTGTSNIMGGDGFYQKGKNLVSCVGVIPSKNPRYVLFVSLEHPTILTETHGFSTGGWIAAPTLRKIAARIMPFLHFSPTTSSLHSEKI